MDYGDFLYLLVLHQRDPVPETVSTIWNLCKHVLRSDKDRRKSHDCILHFHLRLLYCILHPLQGTGRNSSQKCLAIIAFNTLQTYNGILPAVADPDLQIRGGQAGHPDPEIRGG